MKILRCYFILITLAFSTNTVAIDRGTIGSTGIFQDQRGQDDFDSVNIENRLYRQTSFSCGIRSDRFVDELQDELSAFPPEEYGIGTAFDICNAKFEHGNFLVHKTMEKIEGVFLLGVGGDKDINYWMFVFKNGVDVTKAVFGDNNLVQARSNRVITIPIVLERVHPEDQSILSVLAINADIAKNDLHRFSSFFTSTELRVSGSTRPWQKSELNFIHSQSGSYDPYPEDLSYSINSTLPGDKTNIIFSIGADQEYSELSTIFIDFKNGTRINANCGAPSPGLVNFRYSGSSTSSINCDMRGNDLKKSVLVVMTPDYFTDSEKSNNSGAFNARFMRFLKTH